MNQLIEMFPKTQLALFQLIKSEFN